MSEEHVPKVVNAHWFGGPDKLPPNTVYIGRPSPFGNPHSSTSGKRTREECIALHRIDLYRSLIDDPLRLPQLRADLGGRDLACWCKQPKRVIGCHGDNFLHVLSLQMAGRDYTKSVVNYLMEDLRLAFVSILEKSHTLPPGEDSWRTYIYYEEVREEIAHLLLKCREWDPPLRALEFLIAQLVVDLELASMESDTPLFRYHMDHAIWITNCFITGRVDLPGEPHLPDLPLKRKPKGSKS